MGSNIKHIIFSSVLALTLLLPIGISLAHALNDHNDSRCLADSESHVHSEKSDCEHVHYFINSIDYQAYKIPSLSVYPSYNKLLFLRSYQTVKIFRATGLDRGPPFINVL